MIAPWIEDNVRIEDECSRRDEMRTAKIIALNLRPGRGSVNADLGLEDATIAALRTFGWARQPVVAEGKAARTAPCRDHDNTVAGGTGGANHVPERVLDVGAGQPDLAREARHRSRLTRQHVDQLFSKRHRDLF
jgi:hypothetical protein